MIPPAKIWYYILILLVSLSFWSTSTWGQQNDEGRVMWSSTRKLKQSDFTMKLDMVRMGYSTGQFGMGYELHFYDMFSKNFTKNVFNYMVPAASYIDTSAYVAVSLMYQQTLFDISEIYARQFRKALKENRRKLRGDLHYAQVLSEEASTACTKRKAGYDRETNYGRDLDKHKEWETVVQKELNELSDFATEEE